ILHSAGRSICRSRPSKSSGLKHAPDAPFTRAVRSIWTAAVKCPRRCTTSTRRVTSALATCAKTERKETLHSWTDFPSCTQKESDHTPRGRTDESMLRGAKFLGRSALAATFLLMAAPAAVVPAAPAAVD